MPSCFVDQGLTVLDTCTGLEWEKKDTAVGSGIDAGNLNDVDNLYSWSGRCTLNTAAFCQPNAAAAATCVAQAGGPGCGLCAPAEGGCETAPFGSITTIWDWVNQLNAAGFAGHSDWRVATVAGCCGFPTGAAGELESIVDLGAPGCGVGNPCIDPIFGPTVADSYWSVTFSDGPNAWVIRFEDGILSNTTKHGSGWVRAVRSGS